MQYKNITIELNIPFPSAPELKVWKVKRDHTFEELQSYPEGESRNEAHEDKYLLATFQSESDAKDYVTMINHYSSLIGILEKTSKFIKDYTYRNYADVRDDFLLNLDSLLNKCKL